MSDQMQRDIAEIDYVISRRSHSVHAAWQRIRASLEQAPPAAVPDDWQIVPKYLPDEVLEAVGAINGYDGRHSDDCHREWWDDVLAALAQRKESGND